MKRIFTSTYRGVTFRHLSITQIMVAWGDKEFLADGHMAAMAMVDELLAQIELD